VVTIAIAADMGNGPGTMGLGLAGFLGVWVLMMAAMMLPSATPLISLYVRTMSGNRGLRSVGLAAGYLAVWGATGVPAYVLADLGGRATVNHPTVAHVLAVMAFTICGLYQISPAKDRCLQHCRSPLGHLMKYAGYTGRWRDVKVGVHHGAWCLA